MRDYFNNIKILILFLTLFIVLYPIIDLFVLIFPIDDAYIVIKQADQLIKGEFLNTALMRKK